MGRKRKPPYKGDWEGIVMRRNIEVRLEAMFPKATGPTQQYELIGKLAGVGAETIRKFMAGESSMTYKNLQSLAQAVGLTMIELFTPSEPPRKDGPDASDDRGSGSLQPR